MDLSGLTVLITGGTSGIGLALAERFLEASSTVVVCGRRQGLLDEIKAKHPTIFTRHCDVADPEARVALRDWAVARFPGLTTVVNNAGIQRYVHDLGADEPWEETWSEVEINVGAVIHLSRLFLPHLRTVERAAIINVTSGLSFVPKTDVAVYCATKAAVHSFTLSLRELERARERPAGSPGPVRVVEIVPPAVNTDLGGPGLHDFGAPLDEFADSVFKDLARGEDTVYFGFSGKIASAAPGSEAWEGAFKTINALGKK